MKRRESRETAFCLLFEWSFTEEPMAEIIRMAGEIRGEEADSFAAGLASKAIEQRGEIDALIGQYSERWKISRISRVILAALRLAFCELLYHDNIPEGATINEAVELVKKYGTEDEAAYLNGVLGSYVRETGLSKEPKEPEGRI